MTLFLHELKMNRVSFIVWFVSVAALCGGCIFLFPMVEESMAETAEAFSAMGGFSAAFGMDKLSIATLEGFFGTEIGTIYALGGGMFAAITGITLLSKEESGHTAEFLHTLPMGRCSIVTSKLIALVSMITAFDLMNFGVFAGSIAILGEDIDMMSMTMYMLAQYLCHLEIAAVCFALSACLKRSQIGIGLGFALILYVLDLMGRITEEMESLKYITPFYYANATDIFVNEGEINLTLAAIGIAVTIIGIGSAYFIYNKRDIAA